MSIKERMISLDFLRGMAIVFIVFAHIHNYMSGNIFWESTAAYFKIAGLGIFIFISGFLIDVNDCEETRSYSGVLAFYKKRLLRVLPLNWLALLVFVFFTFVLFPVAFPSISPTYYPQGFVTFSWLLPQLVGAQLFLNNFTSLAWFVSLVLICYLLYPFLVRFSKNTLSLILISLLPLLLFGALRVGFGLIDDRMFWFYMAFIGGIAVNRSIKDWHSLSSKTIAFIVVACVTLSFIYFWNGTQAFFSLHSNLNFWVRDTIVMDVAICSGCVFLLWLLSNVRISSAILKYKGIITFVAVSSYCVYLFHFQFFTLGLVLVGLLKLPASVNDAMFYFLIIPLTFIFSYYIQAAERKLVLVSGKARRFIMNVQQQLPYQRRQTYPLSIEKHVSNRK